MSNVTYFNFKPTNPLPPPHKKKTVVDFNHFVFCWTKKPKKTDQFERPKTKPFQGRGTTLGVGVHPSLLGLLQHTACKAGKTCQMFGEKL